MTLTNPPKAVIALAALICITVLLVTDAIGQDAGTGLMGMIVGYAVGNGIAARNGDPVQPIIGRIWTPSDDDRRRG